MNRNVAVIGTGETVFRSHHPDKTYVDLAQEAVVAALRDANMVAGRDRRRRLFDGAH